MLNPKSHFLRHPSADFVEKPNHTKRITISRCVGALHIVPLLVLLARFW